MKKCYIYILILATIVMGGLSLSETYKAEIFQGTYGSNFTWSVNTETGVLEISGEGEMPQEIINIDYPWFPYRQYINSIKINEGVTSIAPWAFAYYPLITSVELPESLECIELFAFLYCTGLKDIEIPRGVKVIDPKAFERCECLYYVVRGSYAHQYFKNSPKLRVIEDEYVPVTLYFVVPKTVNSPRCWNNGIYLCYSNDYKLNTFTKLELTETSTSLTPELKTDSLIPGTYQMYAITLTKEQADAINAATFVSVMNRSNTYRTYVHRQGNILKAPVDGDADSYNKDKIDVALLNGYTFVMNGEVQLGTSIQGYGTYTGYWNKYAKVSVVVLDAAKNQRCWKKGVYLAYSNHYSVDSFTKIRMEKSNAPTEYIRSKTDQLITNSSYNRYTISLTCEQIEAINNSTYVCFMNSTGDYRTYIHGGYNIFKAPTETYSDSYSTTKASVTERADYIFIVCGGLDTNTSIEGYGTFTGYWREAWY